MDVRSPMFNKLGPLGQNGSPKTSNPLHESLLNQIAVSEAADLARAGNYTQAEAILAPMIVGRGTVPSALDLLARIRAQQGRFGEAESLWTQACQLEPSSESFRAGLRRIVELRGGTTRYRINWSTLVVVVSFSLLALVMWSSNRQIAQFGDTVDSVSRSIANLEQKVAEREVFQVAVPPSEEKAKTEAVAVPMLDLAESVQKALRSDLRTSAFAEAIKIEQIGRGVRLKGVAPNLETRLLAESVAREVKGVDLVDVGSLSVEYTVRPGDTLSSIALLYFGDRSKWPLIQKANADKLTDPSIINVGTRLVIPFSDIR